MTRMASLFIMTCCITNNLFAESECYFTGNGPIMTCLVGRQQVDVRKSFKDANGDYYSWNHHLKSYCYRNKQDVERCLQGWKLKGLKCSESQKGVYCE